MEALKSMLKARAVAQHGIDIKPVLNRKTLDDCFQIDEGELQFWYNTPDDSTHIKRISI